MPKVKKWGKIEKNIQNRSHLKSSYISCGGLYVMTKVTIDLACLNHTELNQKSDKHKYLWYIGKI